MPTSLDTPNHDSWYIAESNSINPRSVKNDLQVHYKQEHITILIVTRDDL